MNEIQFRKQCVIDPHTNDPGFRQAIHDPELAAIREEYLRFETQLDEAMRVNSALELESLKKISHVKMRLSGPGANGWLKPRFSMAASFVAAMVIAVGILFRPAPALSDSMMDHLYDHMEVTHVRTIVPQQQLDPLLKQFDLHFTGTFTGSIRHVSECKIGKLAGLHMVFDGKAGPVTLFYVPNASVERVSMMGRNEFHGILFEYGAGTIGIIGVMDEDLLSVKHQVEAALAWNRIKQV